VQGDGIAPAPQGRVGFHRRGDGIAPGFTYPVDAARFIGRGGTSHVWGGFCPRLRPVDFGSGSTPNAWPIRYADLEPYYVAAERELAVETGFEAATDARADAIALVTETLKGSGFTFEFTPLSKWRTRPINVAQSHLPEFEKLAPAMLATDARVTRIAAGGNGRIDAFEVTSRAGVKRQVRAGVFVLAVGGIEAPRLLLLSRSPEYPAGIGNQHDLVGRHFMEHLQTDAEGWRGARTNQARPVETISWQFYDEFKAAGRGGMALECQAPRANLNTIGLAPIMEMEPSPDNRVQLDSAHRDRLGNPAARVALAMSARDIETVKRSDEVMRQILSKIGMTTTATGTFLGLLHHHMGACRMAGDPAHGVVDPNLRVHGTENLYVAGSASFPTSGASPPTLTIVALSLRLADHLESLIRASHQSSVATTVAV
ncbi:MAG: GMC oxidoreductase, partial [Vicinamibacterales bacterium]